jgi:hypothetical protein
MPENQNNLQEQPVYPPEKDISQMSKEEMLAEAKELERLGVRFPHGGYLGMDQTFHVPVLPERDAQGELTPYGKKQMRRLALEVTAGNIGNPSRGFSPTRISRTSLK